MSSLAEKMYQRCHDGTASSSSTNSRPGSASKNPMTATRPAFLTCYLCGQGFGTSSLKIHQPQCYIKRLLQWEKGDPAIRGPKPTNPEDRALGLGPSSPTSPSYGAGGGGAKLSREAIDSFNDAQFNEFNEKSLVPCENCGRTFFPDRLQVHLRSCKPGSASKPAPKRPATSTAASATPRDANGIQRGGVQRLGGGDGGGASATRQSAPSFERPPSISRPDYNSSPKGLNDDDAPRMADDVIVSPTVVNYSLATDEDYPIGGRVGGAQDALSNGAERSHSADQLIINNNDEGVDVRGSSTYATNNNNGYDGEYEQVEGGIAGGGDEEEDDSIAGGNFGEDTPIIPKRNKVQIHRPLDLSKALANRPSIFSGGGAAAESSLKPCQYCRRTFAPDRIEKHESVCTEKKTIVLSKGTPRRVPGGGGGLASSSTAGSVPGSVRSSVTALPLSNIRRGEPARSSMVAASGGASTSRGKSPCATTGSARSTTPRAGGGSVMINGVPTTSARPSDVIRQLPTTNGPMSSSRSPVRESARGYPPASLAPIRSSVSPSREEVISPTPQQPSMHDSSMLSTGRAKFCTECGAKILSATQKFCGECGNRVADM